MGGEDHSGVPQDKWRCTRHPICSYFWNHSSTMGKLPSPSEPQGCDFPTHSFSSGPRETLQPESLLLGVAFAARPDQSSRATDCSFILPSTVQTRAGHGRIPSRNCPVQEATQTGHPEEGSRDQGPGQGLGTCLARRRAWPWQQQLWGGPEHCQGYKGCPLGLSLPSLDWSHLRPLSGVERFALKSDHKPCHSWR